MPFSHIPQINIGFQETENEILDIFEATSFFLIRTHIHVIPKSLIKINEENN